MANKTAHRRPIFPCDIVLVLLHCVISDYHLGRLKNELLKHGNADPAQSFCRAAMYPRSFLPSNKGEDGGDNK
jgi:hypothetical protein